jgi:hypothetical protein
MWLDRLIVVNDDILSPFSTMKGTLRVASFGSAVR